jgi:hypothetical protein
MGDPAYDDTTDITIPSRGENKLVVTNYAPEEFPCSPKNVIEHLNVMPARTIYSR